MLSGFLKKLIFARQFMMSDGKIEVLGKRQIMFPSDILVALQAVDEKRAYQVIKTNMKRNLEYYSKKIGATSAGMLKSSEDIFETFGLGQIQVIKLENDKKSALVRIVNTPLAEDCRNCNIKNCVLHNAALSGMFSFLFNKDVDAETTECMLKNKRYCEFSIH